MPIIWPHYNPGELHTQDLNAFQVFDQSERARAEDRMKRDQLNRAAEQEATRQAGVMEYNQLRASGMSPEDAYFRTAAKINAGGTPNDIGQNTHWMGTSPKVSVEKPQFRNVGGNLMRLDPGAKDWTMAVQGTAKTTGSVPVFTDNEQEQLSALEQQLTEFEAGQKPPVPGRLWGQTTFPAPVPLNDVQTARLNQLREEKKRWLERYGSPPLPGQSPGIPPSTGPTEPKAGSTAYNARLTAPSVAPVKEVVMVVRGRRAIFDANTKKFLRYAD
jgi:hypothetical protein